MALSHSGVIHMPDPIEHLEENIQIWEQEAKSIPS